MLPAKRPHQGLVTALILGVLSLLALAVHHRLQVEHRQSASERRLTVAAQTLLDRLVGPGHASAWLRLAGGPAHLVVTLDANTAGPPERLRQALESLLSLDPGRGDRLEIVAVPGHRGPSLVRDLRQARLLLAGSLILALATLTLLLKRGPKLSWRAPAWMAWSARIAFGVLALGLPLWMLAVYFGATSLAQLTGLGVVLLVVGRPWRISRPLVVGIATLVFSGLYATLESPEADMQRLLTQRLGTPAWVEVARRETPAGRLWGCVAAVTVNPHDPTASQQVGNLEAVMRSSLPGLRLSLVGVGPSTPRGPWALAALLAGLILAGLYRVSRGAPVVSEPAQSAPASHPAPAAFRPAESVMQLMAVDAVAVEVGRQLVYLVDPNQGARLLNRITGLRRHLAHELGVVLPGVRFRDNLELAENEWRILLRGVEVARGSLTWITSAQRAEAHSLGAVVFDEVSVVATQLTETLRRQAHQLVNLEETGALLDNLRKTKPNVVHLAEERVGLLKIWAVLQGLLREAVSIRDLEVVLQSLVVASLRRCPASGASSSVEALIEACRDQLAAGICQRLVNPQCELLAFELPKSAEQILRQGMPDQAQGAEIEDMLGRVVRLMEEAGRQPVVLTEPGQRAVLRRLSERLYPQLTVLSWTQVAPGVKVVEVEVDP